MGKRSSVVSAALAVTALFLLPAVSNIEANALPSTWTPYLWVTWPAGLVLVIPLIYFDVRQRTHERLSTGENEGASADQHRLSLAADVLAAAVRRQWAEEKRLRLLDHPVPLRVRWASTMRPVTAALSDVVVPSAISARPRALRGDGTEQMSAVFRAVRDRQLVILGAPGAGKSALALLFVLHQLGQRRPGDPVAVLLNVSSWDPRTEHLRAWLARRISEEYPSLRNTAKYGAHAPATLLAEGRVIVVLDGLDEMPAQLRPIALTALDHAAATEQPIVVTCRSNEYEAAVTSSGAFLSRAAVLEIQPLDFTAVSRFLTATRPAADTSWRAVLDELQVHPDAPLAKVLASPLMIALARTVYSTPSSSPDELLDSTRFTEQDEIESHLLDAFVPTVYHQVSMDPASSPVSGRLRYPPLLAHEWLVLIACHLARLGTGDLAWWRLSTAVGPVRRILAVVLACSLITDTAFLILSVPQYIVLMGSGAGLTLRACLAATLLFGPSVGLAFGLLYGSVTRFTRSWFEPSYLQLRLPRGFGQRTGRRAARFVKWFQIGLLGGAVIALGVGPAGALERRLLWGPVNQSTSLSEATSVDILVFIPVFGIACGLVFGTVAALEMPVDIGSATTPSNLLAANRTTVLRQIALIAPILTLAITFGGMLWINVLHGALGPLTWPLSHGVFVGLDGGLTGAACYAVAFTAWGQWVLFARILLPLTGRLPWKLMSFFEDAHQHGVLRQSGAMYEFRHVRLRDRLAHADPKRGVARPGAGRASKEM